METREAFVHMVRTSLKDVSELATLEHELVAYQAANDRFVDLRLTFEPAFAQQDRATKAKVLTTVQQAFSEACAVCGMHQTADVRKSICEMRFMFAIIPWK